MLVEGVLVSIGDYLSYGVLFIITLLINRYYGTAQLGTFTLAVTISQIAILPLSSGFSGILRREVATTPALSSKYVTAVLQLRSIIILSMLVLITIYTLSALQNTFVLLMFVSKGLDNLCETFYTAFQASNKILRCTILKCINAMLLFVTVFGCMHNLLGIEYIYYTHVGISLLMLCVCAIDYIKIENPTYSIDKEVRKYLLVETWPLLFNAIFFQVGARLSVIILAWYVSVQDLGTYSAAINIVSSITMVTNSIGVVLFAYFSRLFIEKPLQFVSTVNKITSYFLISGILLSGILYLLSPFVLKLYGKLPENATWVLQLLALAMTALFAHAPLGSIFTIMRFQKQGMVYAGIMVCLNLSLFFFGTKFFGLLGACMAYIIYQSINTLAEFLILNFYLKQKVLKTIQ